MDDEVVVRMAGDADTFRAELASTLIGEAARVSHIAPREVEFLRDKIRRCRAAVALAGDELVGFGYWCDWESGRFVSHSGLVVRPDQRGTGLGRRLKTVLFESSRAEFPRATLMSLTSSPEVVSMNRSFGFVVVPIDRLTSDPAFWDGCKVCKHYEETQARGHQCCCHTAMILEPQGHE